MAQKKIKKKLKEEERRLEGRQKRQGRRATHLFHPENIRELRTINPLENCQPIKCLRTANQ